MIMVVDASITIIIITLILFTHTSNITIFKVVILYYINNI